MVVFSFIFQRWNPSEINQFALVFVVNEKWTRLIHSQSHISKGLNPGHMIQERDKVETRSNCDTKLCFFAVISGGIRSLNIARHFYILYPRGHLSCDFGRFSPCSKVKYDFGLWICASTEQAIQSGHCRCSRWPWRILRHFRIYSGLRWDDFWNVFFLEKK